MIVELKLKIPYNKRDYAFLVKGFESLLFREKIRKREKVEEFFPL